MVRRRRTRPPETALLVADALGLALFSVAGAQIAERAGISAVGGIVLGTITGSAGGAVRDVLSAEIPLVLRRGNLYASAAIAGTAVYFALEGLGMARSPATLIGMAVVARRALRVDLVAAGAAGVPPERDGRAPSREHRAAGRRGVMPCDAVRAPLPPR